MLCIILVLNSLVGSMYSVKSCNVVGGGSNMQYGTLNTVVHPLPFVSIVG